jgi:hypothetical protein
MHVVETLLRIMSELPPKDHSTMIFCNTHAACRNLHSWLSGLPEALDLFGGLDRLAMIHSRIPIEVLKRDHKRLLVTVFSTQ